MDRGRDVEAMSPTDDTDPSIDEIKPFFVPWLTGQDADVGADLESLFERVRTDGALPAKYKSLLVMALDAAENHGKASSRTRTSPGGRGRPRRRS